MKNLDIRSPLLFALLVALSFAAAWFPVSMVKAVRPSENGLVSNEVVQLPPEDHLRTGPYANFFNPHLAGPNDPVEVMIELDEPPAIEAYVRERDALAPAGRTAQRATAAARAQLARIEQSQQKLVAALANPQFKAKITGRVQRVFNGLVAHVASGKLAEIHALPGVKAVHISGLIYPATDTSVPFIKAPQVWGPVVESGFRGEGITVAVLDSGIDYTHRHLGGSGSTLAFDSNNPAIIGDIADFPNAKVTGGVDLVGSTYNAADPNNNTPNPDPDPVDCKENGHGTSVAGIIAGLGVNANGTPFNGPYLSTTNFSSLSIGPGVAPKATLFPINVFSCNPLAATTTAIVTQAIDRAIDPNQDVNFSDRARVVALFGSGPFTTLPNSPVITAINNGAQLNVLYVGASGNGGDTFFSTGGPALASGALSVVNSIDNGLFNQNILVTSPANIAGKYPAAVATFGNAFSTTIAGNVVYAVPNNACESLSNAAQMTGKIAFIDIGTCSPATKVRNAQAAGAVAAIIGNDTTTLPTSVGGFEILSDIEMHFFLMNKDGADRVRVELNGGQVVQASITPGDVVLLPGLADTMAVSSPRGPGLSTTFKPDIAAPGTSIIAASAGSGNLYHAVAGTSMAAPHVAGVAALMAQKHPDATTRQVYSTIRSTGAKVFSGPNGASPELGPSKVGGGRVDAKAAVDSDAWVNTGPVPIITETRLYGDVVEADATASFLRRVRFNWKNVTRSTTFSVVVQNLGSIPGLNIVVPNTTGTAAPNSTVDIPYEYNINPSALKSGCPPGVSPTQAGNPRHCPSGAEGYFVINLDGGHPSVRTPYSVIVRPASQMGTVQNSIDLSGATGTFPLNLTGQGVNNGPTQPADWRSLVTPFELQGIDANEPDTPPELDFQDVRYVGVKSNYATAGGFANTRLYFAISTYGNWASTNQVRFNILFDTNRDGQDDFHVFSSSLANAENFPSDVFITRGFNISTGVPSSLAFFLNAFSAAQLDTAIYHTNIISLPFSPSAIGLTEGNAKFIYRVTTSVNNVTIDSSAPYTYDATKGLDFGPSTTYFDVPGTSITVNYNRDNFLAAKSEGVLLLHHLNVNGTRDQILPANIGLEGDLDGDGDVDVTDHVLAKDFLLETKTPELGRQFQHADDAPRDTKGNGDLSVADLVQTGRNAVGLDPPTPAGGPLVPSTTVPLQVSPSGSSPVSHGASQARTVRAVNASFTQGQTNALDIEIDALGGENASGFSLNFDPAVLSFVSANLAAELPPSSIFGVNSSQAGAGRLGVVVALPPGQSLAAGTRRIARVSFTLVAGSTVPSTVISFNDLPLRREVANVTANVVTAGYTNAQIALIRIAAHVSAASFTGASLASQSIVAAFGVALAVRLEIAATSPLPTLLGGTTVKVKDSAGAERLASLFFVSGGQVNYAIPAGTALGPAVITITAENGAVSTASISIEAVAPGLFSANSNAIGVAAAQVVRVKGDGSQVVESVAVFDAGANAFVAAPIDLGPPTEQVFLVLFGTAMRNRSSLSAAQLVVGGTNLGVEFLGDQGSFVGLDQLNALISRSLIGRGQVNVQLTVDGKPANVVHINIR